MANTYTLISSNVLASNTASVTFSSIPATFTDLVLRWSSRSTSANASIPTRIIINGLDDTTSNLSETKISTVNSSTVTSSRDSNIWVWQDNYVPGAGGTSNTFGSSELYLPNYTSTSAKPGSRFSVSENNSTTDIQIGVWAELNRQSAAITSIKIEDANANFASGSSFYLYGIKNS
jgi:hypothetical protein